MRDPTVKEGFVLGFCIAAIGCAWGSVFVPFTVVNATAFTLGVVVIGVAVELLIYVWQTGEINAD